MFVRASAWLEPDPHSVIPEPPTIRAGVPDGVSPRRPRRWRWWRRRPRRWCAPPGRAGVVVPVVAVIPVPVVAPARVPLFARTPVIVIHGCRRRRRLGGAGGQSKSGHGHAAGRERAGAQAKPRFCLHVGIHALKMPGENEPETLSIVLPGPQMWFLTGALAGLRLRAASPNMSSGRKC